MDYGDIDERGWSFLLELCQRTNGDTSVQVSMYEIGEALGLDRDNAKRLSEELISWNLIDIRTLSGGISISQDGIAEAHKLSGSLTAAEEIGFKIGKATVIDEDGCRAIEEITHLLILISFFSLGTVLFISFLWITLCTWYFARAARIRVTSFDGPSRLANVS